MKSLENGENQQVILWKVWGTGKINRLSYKKSVWRTGKINRLSYKKSGERETLIGYPKKSLENGENSIFYPTKSLENGKNSIDYPMKSLKNRKNHQVILKKVWRFRITCWFSPFSRLTFYRITYWFSPFPRLFIE
jgi:hypothetical protein